MTPYPEYKETGLAWLPQVPKHWDVVRAKQIFTPIDVRSQEGKEQLLSVSERYGVVKRENANVTMFMASSYEGYKLCWPDDLAINSLWAWSYGLGFSKYYGIISTAYSVFRLRDKAHCCPRFYDYFVRSKNFHWELRVRSKGLWKSRYQLADDAFLAAPLILPSIDEQTQIVRYLDFMTVKINKLIRAKKRQIALLQEQKQAIINQAVTKGLEPNAEMKDSGIDWLGNIPKHWILNKTGHMYRSILGKMLANTPSSASDTFEYYLCAKDVHFSGVDTSDLKQMWFSASEKQQYKLHKGDLLVVEGGAGAAGAAIFKEDGNIYIQNSIHLVRPRTAAYKNELLYYWLYAMVNRKYVDYACNKATIPHFTKDKLFEMPFPAIPAHEQDAIIKFLDERCKKIDMATAQLKHEIDFALEYKNSFISSVVTGQTDVRNIEIPDFDAADLNLEDDPAPDPDERDTTSPEESEVYSE